MFCKFIAKKDGQDSEGNPDGTGIIVTVVNGDN